MEDVTKRVQAALKEGMTSAEALKAGEAEIARIEKESLDKTRLIEALRETAFRRSADGGVPGAATATGTPSGTGR
jgi:hypothetical protein